MLFGIYGLGLLLLFPLANGAACSQHGANDAVINDLVELLGMLKLKVDLLQSAVDELKPCDTSSSSTGVANGGVSYIRWGRTSCEGDSSVLYSGFMSGAHYNVKGSGSNFLCLPRIPEWNRVIEGGVTGKLYGVEYEIGTVAGTQGLVLLDNNGGTEIMDHPAPCVTCLAALRAAKIMIPARRTCPIGWTKEYEGYLVSQWHGDRGRSDYVCLDEAPETAVGGGTSQDQAFIYMVEVGCGTLPCANYTSGYQLACVVCTK